jgi:hypothetical protein
MTALAPSAVASSRKDFSEAKNAQRQASLSDFQKALVRLLVATLPKFLITVGCF